MDAVDACPVRTGHLLRARDPQAAARSAALILSVCAACVAGLALFQPMGPLGEVATWVGSAFLAAGALLCRVVRPETLDRCGGGVFIALGGVSLACILNLLTNDTSAAAQAFLAFPVLWAAAHLRPSAVWLVTATAVAGDGVILFWMRTEP